MISRLKYVLLTLVLGFGLTASATPRDTYTVIDQVTDTPSAGLVRTKYTVQIGTNPLNRIGVTRVRARAHVLVKGPVILAAPFVGTSLIYEIGKLVNHNGTYINRYGRSLAGIMAYAGLDTWIIDDRNAFGVTIEDCQTGAVDCSIMGTWNFAARVEDVRFVRDQLIAPRYPNVKPAIGGFSGGSVTAIAAINADPAAYSGAYLQEGTPYSADPAIQSFNAGFCAGLQGALNAGVVADGGIGQVSTIAQLALTDPTGVSPIPGFPPGFTNLQAYLAVVSVPPNPPQPLNPTPSFIRNAADIGAATFTYAKGTENLTVVSHFPQIAALAPVADIDCGLAGVDNQYVNSLSSFTGKVLIHGAELGFGPMMADTATLFTSAASVDTQMFAGHGESDVMFKTTRVKDVFIPAAQFFRGLF